MSKEWVSYVPLCPECGDEVAETVTDLLQGDERDPYEIECENCGAVMEVEYRRVLQFRVVNA